jgi:hypothetical protein
MFSKIAAILSGAIVAIIAIAVAYVVLGVCLGQLLEDVRPGLVPLVDIGVFAILIAVGISTFRFVFRKMRGGAVIRARL